MKFLLDISYLLEFSCLYILSAEESVNIMCYLLSLFHFQLIILITTPIFRVTASLENADISGNLSAVMEITKGQGSAKQKSISVKTVYC